jgi:hypothetical protein
MERRLGRTVAIMLVMMILGVLVLRSCARRMERRMGEPATLQPGEAREGVPGVHHEPPLPAGHSLS